MEAHGTGTALGDPIEVSALSSVLCSKKARGPLYVGAAKTQLGHLEAVAGLTGLLKVAVELSQQLVSRNLHFRALNQHIYAPGLVMMSTVAPQQNEFSRGVSSFGMSGTNAHAQLPGVSREHKPLMNVSKLI